MKVVGDNTKMSWYTIFLEWVDDYISFSATATVYLYMLTCWNNVSECDSLFTRIYYTLMILKTILTHQVWNICEI